MIELFADIPEYFKLLTQRWVNTALEQNNVLTGTKMIQELLNVCQNEQEKEFVDFYFNLRVEQLKNESNND